MAAGLPPKPYVPPTAPAPPLPAGPAPQSYTQDPAAAHAAAWAAYYQSQGLTAQGQPQPAGYNAQPQPQQAGPQQPGAANPYANYGYGAQAAQAHVGGPTAQPGYRPPQAQQGYQYSQQPQQAGYASPAPAPYQAPQQGYAGYSQPQQPQGYTAPAQGWGQPGPQQPQQGYRPPAQPYNGPPGQQQQPPYFNGGAQQPFTPPHAGGQTPYRSSPGMSQNRPYAPQAQPMAPRQRPPMNNGPTPPHHPPAKRPRFDGPPNQGPTHLGGPRNASLPIRPGSIPNRPPSGPRTPLPPPPITRPPIHLGTGGPPPVFAPNGPRGITPSRGGRGGGRGGMVMNAPRGPSHLRRERQDQQRQNQRSVKDHSPGKRDKKDKKKEKEKDTAKTTLTDFRIVGIEMKELGWSWGLVGEEAMNQAEEEEQDEPKASGVEDVKTEAVQKEVGSAEPSATTEDVKEDPTDPVPVPESEPEVKTEVEGESAEVKDESAPETDAPKAEVATEPEEEEGKGKTGGKRKAQSPETDEGSSKKRSTYLLTHGKANDTDTPSQESKNNQNRFRIYFESPPEADRIPQALRRNPYKRWRREDSAVPTTTGGEGELAAIEETEQETGGDVVEGVVNGSTEGVPLAEDATYSGAVGVEPHNGPNDLTANNVPVDQVAEFDSTTEVLETAAPSAENGQTVGTAEAIVPAVIVETSVEVPATTTEEAPVVTEPPMEDELPVPASSAEGVQPPAESAISTENDPPGNGETVTEPTPVATTDTLTAAEATTETPSADTATADGAVAPAPASAEETAVAIAQSAENAASAYKSRTRRRSSVSSTDSRETLNAFQPEVTPSMNRLSILYEGSQRRMCFDAEVVERIEVYRSEGRIEVIFTTPPKTIDEDNELLPKGYLLEEYNQEDQRFAPVSRERLEEIYTTEETSDSIPPLHRHFITPDENTTKAKSDSGLRLSVYLNQKNPLSVPRWCRNNSADEWLYEQFGSKHSAWRAKLLVMDPDPPPTLASILESWSSSSTLSSSTKRTTFIQSLLSEPSDLLEILLRLTRGDRNPPVALPLASAIKADSPYATHQTHVSLAILAMYRLTTDYATQAGVEKEVVNEKIGDIIKSLPGGMISRSLDGMFKEWDGRKK